MANTVPKTCVIFVGNPGVGKSTLLNSVLGKLVFKSGVEFGTGLTQILQWISRDGVFYGDTPGLSDIMIREKAAAEITKAMQQNGNYKLFFVIELVAGRARADDVTTMQLVLEAVASVPDISYGIIINKMKPSMKALLSTNPDKYHQLLDCLFSAVPFAARSVFLNTWANEAHDENDVLIDADPEFVNFIDSFPSVKIDDQQVAPVKADKYDEIREKAELKIAEIQKKAEEAILVLKAEAERQRIVAAEEAKRQQRAVAEAETKRREAEAERQRIAVAAEAERQRHAAAQAELQRQAVAERQRREVAEHKQREAEAERQRIVAAEAERQRQAIAEAQRKQREAEAERQRQRQHYNAQREATKTSYPYHPGGYNNISRGRFDCCGKKDNDRYNGCATAWKYTMPECPF